MGRKPRFSEETKLKCFLWSARHCCICDKNCGLDIEIGHIDQDGGDDIDNAIPVCYEHHAQIGRYVYDRKHPRGNKYRIKELKKRRDQIYDKYTRHLVPPLVFYLTPRMGDSRFSQIRLPRVGFVIENHGLFLPVKIKVNIQIFLDSEKLRPIVDPKKPYYTSEGIMWNLNAGHTFFGNFSIPKKCCENTENLKIEIQIIATNPYDREHPLLPTCYSYTKDKGWFTEPTSFSELKKFMDNPLKNA